MKNKETSPNGIGIYASKQQIGKLSIGRNGKVWVVNKNKKWRISKFYKKYIKSEKKCKKLFKKSVIDFTFISIYDTLKKDKNWFIDQKNTLFFPMIKIKFTYDTNGKNIGLAEFKNIAKKSNLFTYVTYDGYHFGPMNKTPILTLYYNYNF